MQYAQSQGHTIDPTLIDEMIEQQRNKIADNPLPEWYTVAEVMAARNWTEKQFWEDNSLAMIFRMIWVESLHAEKQEQDRPKGQATINAAPDFSSTGHQGVAGVRARGTKARR